MQYVKISPSESTEVADGSALLTAIMSVPADQRMALYPATDAGVVAYLAAQAEQTKVKKAKQSAKASGLKKFAEATGLTTDEMKALFGG